jgi:AcrR family transcriptional regulator
MPKRPYVSEVREQQAADTRREVLSAAKDLFTRHGIDGVTIALIAKKAKVSVPTVYALYKSKEGILRALMDATLFGPAFQAATSQLSGVSDPVQLIVHTAQIARAIYESERSTLGLVRGASAFSPALRRTEQEFERRRYDMQEERVKLLFAKKRAKGGLALEKARQVLWMYTSRDVYRMLVQESGWTPDEYQQWLSDTLLSALVKPEAKSRAR